MGTQSLRVLYCHEEIRKIDFNELVINLHSIARKLVKDKTTTAISIEIRYLADKLSKIIQAS